MIVETIQKIIINATEENDAGICFLESLPQEEKVPLIYKFLNIKSLIDEALTKLLIRKKSSKFTYPYSVY